MERHQSTTPFGRRPLSLAMVAARAVANACPSDAIAEKWKVLDNLRMARSAIGISDRALSVLNALLTFYQDATLKPGEDLIVFPSNRALTHRANGMAPASLRRNLAALVHAGIILRKDSPNGKRYARKGEGGQIEQAFGFDLRPLVARAAEFEQLAEKVKAEAKAIYLLREEISLLRRDIIKTIEVASNEDLPGPWDAFADRFRGLGGMPPRNAECSVLEAVRDALRALWYEVDKCLSENAFRDNMSVNESHPERHHQNSNTDPNLDCEKGSQTEEEEPTAPGHMAKRQPLKAYPLSLVLHACPDIAMYTRGGQGISSWREFYTAAEVARPVLGISPSAWKDAREVMGEEQACVVVAAMLQRAEMIRNPGAYLRNLTERTKVGQFSLGPMLMALLRLTTGSGAKRA